MNYLNNDFIPSDESKSSSVQELREYYLSTVSTPPSSIRLFDDPNDNFDSYDQHGKAGYFGTLFWNTMVLSERSAKNYSRNLLAYGVRAGMYGGG
jgi:hypothetical protein